MKICACNNNKIGSFLPLCWEDAFSSYFKSIGKDFSYVFASYWKFEYNTDQTNFGDRLSINFDLLGNLREICHIGITFNYINGLNDILKVIDNNLKEDKPSIIQVDTYYLPWSVLYQNAHSFHHLALACGYDEAKKEAYLVDPGHSTEIVSINYELLEKACAYSFDITIRDELALTKKDFLNYWINNESFVRNIHIVKIKEFASNIREDFDYKKEFESPYHVDQVMSSSFISSIRSIMSGRNMFIVFLHTLKHGIDLDFDEIINLLLISISKWNVIIQLLAKTAYTGWKIDIKERMVNIIYDIADIEEKACNELVNLVKNKKDQKTTNDKEILINKKQLFLDLSSYFNNKGIAETIDDPDADLTQMGEFLLLNDYFRNHILEFDQIRYKLASDLRLDNIICEGQSIFFDQVLECRGIAILCCSEWGFNKQIIEIIEEDFTTHNFIVQAYDISNRENFNSFVIGPSIRKVDRNIVWEKATVTHNMKVYEKACKIKKLILPYCTNLHILCITIIQ